MLDLETLRILWWALLGILLVGFAITDGFDFGAAILLPMITRNERERQLVLDGIRPFWEGNQVWIIVGAGALFAAWPFVYAVAFSGFYFLILLLLLTMGISRPVSFKYRDKLANLSWRRTWDWITFIGGLCPAMIFGILMGNAMLGADFYLDDDLRIFYSGSFANLFQPFTWWCGLTSVCMLSMHGGIYIGIKNEGNIRTRAIYATKIAALGLLVFFIGGGVWIAYSVKGYYVTTPINPFGYSNPLHKEVAQAAGAWMRNYHQYPAAVLAPVLGILGAVIAMLTVNLNNSRMAFVFSSVSIAGIITTVGVSMFPFLLPSSTHFSSGLLVWDASSTQLTLLIMLVATAFFLPLITLYTSWVYYVLGGKVNAADIQHTHDNKLE